MRINFYASTVDKPNGSMVYGRDNFFEYPDPSGPQHQGQTKLRQFVTRLRQWSVKSAKKQVRKSEDRLTSALYPVRDI
jgi:hypothetical protein